MQTTNTKTANRWLLLVLGFLSTLTMGVVYAWSIIKVPLGETFGWTTSQLALNYSIMMALFCAGLFVGGQLLRFVPARFVILIGGTMAASGFIITSINPGNFTLLLLTLALLTGTGIGMAYNTILSAVNSWFPDKKGLSTGTLMMGFGLSTLIMGNLAAVLFELESFGWRRTYFLMGILILIVIILAAIFVRFPTPSELDPYQTKTQSNQSAVENIEPGAVVRTPLFVLYFLYFIALTSIGQCVFSFAKDLSLHVGTTALLANLLVGIVSVFNGLGRVLFGIVCDRAGLKKAHLLANIVTLGATVSTLAAVLMVNIPLLVLGLVLTGLSFSSAPTLTSVFVATQFGMKYFPINFSLISLSGILSSLSAAWVNNLYAGTGSFYVPYVVLTGIAVFSFSMFLLFRPKLRS